MRSRNLARTLPQPKAFVVLGGLWVLLATWPSASLAQLASPPAAHSGAELSAQIRDLVAGAALGNKVGLSVIDLSTHQVLASSNAAVPLNPASNMKLLTASTAMIELGPDFRMRTGLYGRIQGDAVSGGLCLKGHADPTLTSADLVLFAQRLADEGVRQVDELIVDGSYFDAQTLPPAFDEQPNEVAPFRAAVAAVSVNGNAYTLRVRPGTTDGAAGIASVDASGYFEIDNGLTTRAKGPPNVIAAHRQREDKLILTLRGTLPLGGSSLAYERRVESPLHYAGYAFIDALRALRIQVPKRVVVGPCPSDAPLIGTKLSPPMSEILTRLGKDSDNFVAEMVLKTIGAERKRKPGRSADGVTVVVEVLKRLAVPTAGLSMVNGSGLFHGNAVTSAALVAILAKLYENPSLRDDFVAHLAVGGVDGTLAHRFRSLPAPRIVRAKTGTLDDVIALSGYVLGPSPSSAIAFSFLANSVTGKHAQARDLIDHVVEAIAAYLYAPAQKATRTP